MQVGRVKFTLESGTRKSKIYLLHPAGTSHRQRMALGNKAAELMYVWLQIETAGKGKYQLHAWKKNQRADQKRHSTLVKVLESGDVAEEALAKYVAQVGVTPTECERRSVGLIENRSEFNHSVRRRMHLHVQLFVSGFYQSFAKKLE